MTRMMTWTLLLSVLLVAAGCQQTETTADVAPAPPPDDLYASAPPPAPEPILTPTTQTEPITATPAYTPQASPSSITVAPQINVTNGTPNNYTVQRGDTLWSIARKVYGNGQKWQQLASANAISDPTKLRVGQTLVVP